jgi:choline dehydrogenase
METYDIAVIGAGSAGCALAARLAAVRTDLRIALVEAGPDYGSQASGSWPQDLVDAHHTPESHDWGFEQSRARVVGGCSAHNECALVRALPGDYDRWRIPGWTDSDLAPAVDYMARTLPITTCPDGKLATWQRAFLDTALGAGFDRLSNGNDVSGVGPFTQNIKDGLRWNAAFAFLDPVRSRLTIISDILADRLVLDGNRARALIGHDSGNGGAHEIHAKHFVLCAGVYGSPAILLRSGIGPVDHLTQLRIPVGIALPCVGANLHDHPGVGLEYEPTTRALRAAKEDLKGGRFYEAQIVLKTSPDLHIVPYQTMEENAGVFSFGILAYYLNPHSRGRVRLMSRNPFKSPAIDLGLLNDPDGHDVDALTQGLKLIHSLTRERPLADAIKRGPRRFTSSARRARFVRNNLTDYGHSVGTCRMGRSPDAGDVVDAGCRVHGLDNVFIADASIIPQIPRANINFTCFVIGVRAAELLTHACSC